MGGELQSGKHHAKQGWQQRGSALSEFLLSAEPWEDRPEMASRALIRVAVIATLACLTSGLLLLLVGGRIVSSGSLGGFFWTSGVDRWFVGIVGSLLGLWPYIVGTGLAGVAVTMFLAAGPTGPRTRYALFPLVAMATAGCGSEMFLTLILVIQFALWVAVIAACVGIVIGLIAAAMSS